MIFYSFCIHNVAYLILRSHMTIDIKVGWAVGRVSHNPLSRAPVEVWNEKWKMGKTDENVHTQ